MPDSALQLLRMGGLLLVFSFCSVGVRAEPVTTIRDNGDPANRVDVVVLGDGYTTGEMTQYAIDVDNAITSLFAQEPFREYQNYFNVHRIDVTSNESGADHPESGIFVDTALDATYNCSGIQRLICVNTSEVNLIVSATVNPDQRDIILVLVNDPEYGGSGGAIAVASTHPDVVELVLHELGHSFGRLADEYDSSPPACVSTVEPWEPNVTMETQRDFIKWNTGGGPPTGWVEFSTTIPTTTTLPETPGLYEGAKYCTSGLFRPTYNSKMRSLNVPFEQVNEEQLVQRIYNLVSPHDSSNPAASSIFVPKGANQSFKVGVPTPSTHFLMADWYADKVFQYSGYEFTLETGVLTTGLHVVEVVTNDPTAKVRHDPANLLTETRSWDIDIYAEIVSLSPASSSNPVGSNHAVTAKVQDDTGNPLEGRKVTISIISGPNAGVSGTGSTDVNGEFGLTYLGNSGPGVDKIEASLVDSHGNIQISGVVTKEWIVVNEVPDCSKAFPSIDRIWPPNHKFVSINVLGVSDPDGDPVNITIDSIFQDEPVDALGVGSFVPDGQGLHTDTAHVRAERSGTKRVTGNGRIYHIGFTADDGQGGSCSGELAVAVPHDKKVRQLMMEHCTTPLCCKRFAFVTQHEECPRMSALFLLRPEQAKRRR
ncbi:MAG: M64 family metallopeptidase [Gammaproteobacteria bacterium]